MTTATDLYRDYPEFAAFINCWVSDRQIPFALVDWLLEQEQNRLAETVREIVDTVFTDVLNHAERSCLYPATMSDFYYWSAIGVGSRFAHDVRKEYRVITIHTDGEFSKVQFATPTLAILAYLDHSPALATPVAVG